MIGITGGIGSGKSVVAEIVRSLGYHVYDCDSRARKLMDSSEDIKRELCSIAGPQTLNPDGSICRNRLAKRLFADAEIRHRVNRLVHHAVREDILRQAESLSPGETLFVESAIMHTSRLDRMMDRIWLVEAPEELRIERVMKRNSLSREEVMHRIAAQKDENRHLQCPHIDILLNDNRTSLLLQIHRSIVTFNINCRF